MVMWEAHANTEGARRWVLNTWFFFFFLNSGNFFAGRIGQKVCGVIIPGDVSGGVLLSSAAYVASLCGSLCVCVSSYLCKCVCVRPRASECMGLCVCTGVCMCPSLCMCVDVCVHVYRCLCARVYCMYLSVCICLCVCVSVCLGVLLFLAPRPKADVTDQFHQAPRSSAACLPMLAMSWG